MSDDQPNRVLPSKAASLAASNNHSQPGWYSRGYLPHFDQAGLTQTLTFRLADALPQTVLNQWQAEFVDWPVEDADRERRKRIDAYLDRGYGNCYLRDERLAQIVQDALLHFDKQRYALHAWCVMPNHVHVLYTAAPGWQLSQLAHSWKSFTANQCNRVLQRHGQFWQPEPFDRYIRDQRHFAATVAYIEHNPVKAGLCAHAQAWRWSSASYREPEPEP